MELVVFDIDGTLLDVFDFHIQSYRDALYALLKLAPDEASLIGSFGKPEADCFRAAVPGRNFSSEELAALSERRTEALLASLPKDLSGHLLPGVKEALDWLRGRVALAFITGNNPGVGSALVRAAGLGRYSENCAFGGQAPTRAGLILIVCARSGVDPRSAFVVGDSIHDMEAARKVGAIPIGVATYRYTQEQLRVAGAKEAFSDMRDVLAYLKAEF